MALNQQFCASPGRTGLICRVEQPCEPGQPRLFWDGAKKQWVGDAAAHLDVVEDPNLPGIYRVLESTEHTATWPPKVYWLTVLDAGTANGLLPISHGPVWVVGGDDGSRPIPGVDLSWPDGKAVHVWGAYAR